MWDSTEVLNMVGSIGILVTALGAVIVNIIVAVKTGEKVEENLKKVNEVSHQVAEVHTLTNSNLSQVKAELTQALGQLAEMKVLVTDLKNERDKLATITALRTNIPNSESAEVLESIDKNTENTAINTKKTTEDVKELKKERR